MHNTDKLNSLLGRFSNTAITPSINITTQTETPDGGLHIAEPLVSSTPLTTLGYTTPLHSPPKLDIKEHIIDANLENYKDLTQTLGSKLWRMDNLYTIADKNGNLVKLKLNKLQRKVLTEYRHNRKIILKSRQIGITTLYCAYDFDDCIFKPNFQAGIQSYGKDESKKLQKKIEIMWDNLDSDIKKALNIRVTANNSNGLEFSNGSVLKIGNFRGDTLQALHVSELAKIAKRYPEKAKELKTGAFQAVGINNKISVESTAEGMTGLFYEMWTKASQKVALGRKLTKLDFVPIFLSWLEDPDCNMDEEYELEPRHISYIEKLESELKIILTQTQKNWLAGKLDELGDDFDQEYPATPERAFAQSVEGTYLRYQYIRLLEEKRVKTELYDSAYKVNVSFDLGVNDEMVLLFVQVINGRPRLINEYHNSGEGLEFYVDIIREFSNKFGYVYDWFILPHDASVKDMSTGRTRIETLRALGITKINLLEKLSFMDSIQAVRQFVNILEVDIECEDTLLAIQNYRKKYDKQLGVYLGTDVHDIHSNYIAALRYMAQGLSVYLINNTIKKEEPKKRKREQISNSYTV